MFANQMKEVIKIQGHFRIFTVTKIFISPLFWVVVRQLVLLNIHIVNIIIIAVARH